jgi:glyoxylase-like metal-dependent hydrolase (beta-lactamase superfamily II)
MMIEVATGVWLLTGFPRYLVNVYLAGDVLIDAATRWHGRWIARRLEGRSLGMVALTHCHPDHQGAAKYLCDRFRVPLACHAEDVPAMEGREPMRPMRRVIRLGQAVMAGPPHPVARVLNDGDEVAGFRVIHTPGHTAGHVIYFRESDRVAIAGDVLANIHFLSGRPGLKEPPKFFSVDRRENRRSMRILADLRPRLTCFGHGRPLVGYEEIEAFAGRFQKD